MSIHHVECAAMTTLPASTKLILMAFADSADKDTRVAFPGLDNVMAWSGLRKSRALEVTAWLVGQGYLSRVTASKPGQRAEYLVFPAGCCAQHAPLDGYDGPDPSNTSGTADPNPPNTSGVPDVKKPVDNSDGSAAPDVFESGAADPFRGMGRSAGRTGPIFGRNGSALDRTPPLYLRLNLPLLLTAGTATTGVRTLRQTEEEGSRIQRRCSPGWGRGGR